MAPLTRSINYQLPELSLDLPLEIPKNENKDIQASSIPITLSNPEIPRLVTYRSKSGICSSCSKTSELSCVDCCGMVFYCNDNCQMVHWPKHKDVCQELKDQHLSEVIEVRSGMSLNQITEDLGKIISSDYKSLVYKKDPKLSVNIEDSAKIGDFYCVSSESFDSRILHVHPGTYKCTSVTIDDSCAPVIIYHHESVDPAKVMKQCILMSKDLFEHWGICYDAEYIPFDSESDSEASDSSYFEISDSDESEFSDSEASDSEFSDSEESGVSDSEVLESDLIFADFVARVLDSMSLLSSDSDDQEYNPTDSDSDYCGSIDDSEVYYLIAQSKQYIRDIKKEGMCYICGRCKDEIEESESESDSDSELSDTEDSEYCTDSDLSTVSEDYEFDTDSEVSSANEESILSDDYSDEDSQDDYDYECNEECCPESENSDEEPSWEEQFYEAFRHEVFKSPKTLCENDDIVFFMNSQYASSVKDAIDNGEIDNGSEIAGSFILKNESESSGIAVDLKNQHWLAHAFRDSTSKKCFALIISTDTWEHLSNNHEHLEAHYPDEKWSSVAETNYYFQMKNFLHEEES